MDTVLENRNPNAPAPLELESAVSSRPKNAIQRDATRYAVQAADLMPPDTKRNFKSLQGVHLGGQYFSLTEIPCLWKFQGFVTRGRITPLIKNAVVAHSSEEIAQKQAKDIFETRMKGEEVRALPEVRRMAFPWDSMTSLLAPHNVVKGATEVSALQGIEWEAGAVQAIQRLIFPDWDSIQVDGELPTTVREFGLYIKSRRDISTDHLFQATLDAFMESNDKFDVYAHEVVKRAQEAVRKGMNDKGFAHVFQAFHIHLARMIEVNLDSTPTVVFNNPAGGNGTAGKSKAELEIERRQVEAQERANELKAIELGLVAAPAPEVDISLEEEMRQTEIPDAVEPVSDAAEMSKALNKKK